MLSLTMTYLNGSIMYNQGNRDKMKDDATATLPDQVMALTARMQELENSSHISNLLNSNYFFYL
jgi:hypothetical protein